MTRTPRDFEPGRVYHLISRFVDRNWYIQTDDERRLYLKFLGRSFEKSDWKCLSDGIMSNHVHLCTVAGEHDFANLIRRVHAPFATWMNRAYQRIGGMFVRGPKALEVRDEGVAAVIAYIHNNPVRAGVVTSAADSTWTSHRAYAGLDRAPRWLDVNEGLRRSGFADGNEFGKWVATNPDVDDVAARVEAAFGELDDDGNIATNAMGEIATPLNLTNAPRLPAQSVVEATAAVLGVPMMRFLAGTKRSPDVLARRVVVHCAGALGLTGVEIGSALGVTQQAISKIQLSEPKAEVLELGEQVLQRLGRNR
jgi:hypothetical protein